MRTEGEDPDTDGYLLQLDENRAEIIGLDTLRSFASVAPGEHTVELRDLARNCQLAGASRRTVMLARATTTRVELVVGCPRLLTGSLIVTLRVSVINWPGFGGKFSVSVDQLPPQPIAVNGSVSFDPISGGNHSVYLGLARGCGFFLAPNSNPRAVWVPSGGVAQVSLSVVCIG